MKGQGFKIISGIILVLLAGGFGFVIINGGVVENLAEQFCFSTGVCGNRTSIISSVAYQSTKSLECAINSVASGKDIQCLQDLEQNEPLGPYVKCTESQDFVCCDKGWFGGEYWTVRDTCIKGNYKIEQPDKYDRCGEVFRTERPSRVCTVVNFELPQELTKWEKWIADYGDPRYLVYWQNFPHEEDRWTFDVDWKIDALILMVNVLPAARAGSILKESKFLAKFANLGEKLKSTANLAKRYVSSGIGEESVKSALKKLAISYRFERIINSPKKMIVKPLLGGVALEGAALAAAQVDSAFGKYDEHPGNLVLKIPFANPFLFELKELGDKPVFIIWRKDLGNDMKIAHFASPCKINNLPVQKQSVLCGAYIFNGIQKSTGCSNPELSNLTIYPTCQNKDQVKDSITSLSSTSEDYIDMITKIQVPQYPLDNIYDKGGVNVPVTKNIVYYATDSDQFVGDKLIVKTDAGNKELLPFIETIGDFEGTREAEAAVRYDALELKIVKFCKKVAGDKLLIQCRVKFAVKGDTQKSCNDDVCQKIKGLSEEGYSNNFKVYKDFKESSAPENINKYTRFEIYSDQSEKDNMIEIRSRQYTAVFHDDDKNNKVDKIDLYNDNFVAVRDQRQLLSNGKHLTVFDANYDGTFESSGSEKCKTESVVLFFDREEKTKDYGTNYCVYTQSTLRSLLEKTGEGIAITGVIFAIISSGGTATPVIGTLTAGALITHGLTISAIPEVFETITGEWP